MLGRCALDPAEVCYSPPTDRREGGQLGGAMADTMPRLRSELLGPLRGGRAGDGRALGWPKQQPALAALLMAAGRTVSRPDLVDVVWGDDPPRSSASLVHTYLGRLRRVLDPDPRPDMRALVSGRSG